MSHLTDVAGVSLLVRISLYVWLASSRLYTSCVRAMCGDDSTGPVLRRKTVLRLADVAVDVRSRSRLASLSRCTGPPWRVSRCGGGELLRLFDGLLDAMFSRAVARRGGLTPAQWPEFPFPDGASKLSYVIYDFSFLGRPVTVVLKRDAAREEAAKEEAEGAHDEDASALAAVVLHGPPHLLATLWKTCFGAGTDASDFFDRFGASTRVPRRASELRLGDLVYVAHAMGCCCPRLLASSLLASSQAAPFHVDVMSLNTGNGYVFGAHDTLPVFE